MFVRGCEKFVPALAYLCCLALPGSCLARFAYFLADLCSSVRGSWLKYPSPNLPCMSGFDFEGFMGRDLFCRRADSNCENGTSNDSCVEGRGHKASRRRRRFKIRDNGRAYRKGTSKRAVFWRANHHRCTLCTTVMFFTRLRHTILRIQNRV